MEGHIIYKTLVNIANEKDTNGDWKQNKPYLYVRFLYHRDTKHKVLWVIKTEKHIIMHH